MLRNIKKKTKKKEKWILRKKNKRKKRSEMNIRRKGTMDLK